MCVFQKRLKKPKTSFWEITKKKRRLSGQWEDEETCNLCHKNYIMWVLTATYKNSKC